ncbi:hypothetical protein BC777_2352 [Yoonia maricola]|uniref:Uncharacterized protein n=1 Tax=Yoonia maricola TaxID=420999 RepID=A0A2M8W513_9RHOB|nr:hypothetical protein [Yoonia maricola]PJI85998.1 hypothetical protein BC777_2352 [Yoonia maricola]
MPALRWLTRDDDVRAAENVPYRLLEEVRELGYGDRDAGNMLIQGDKRPMRDRGRKDEDGSATIALDLDAFRATSA